MRVTEKMKAFGLKALAEATGHDLVTMYRWIKKIEGGRGIALPNQRALIEATAGSEHALAFVDFLPDQEAAA